MTKRQSEINTHAKHYYAIYVMSDRQSDLSI